MSKAQKFKLTLNSLKFLSLVDVPAQEPATVRLIKRRTDGDEIQASMTSRIIKVDDGDDPLIYCWAFNCTDENGEPYHDLQGDAIDTDTFIKAAELFMREGGAVDRMHDSQQAGHVAFAFPMVPEIAKAMFGDAGAEIKQSGLMTAIRASPEDLAKVRSGEYTGVSIAGTGIRELLTKAAKPPAKDGKKKDDDKDGKKKPAPPWMKSVSKQAVLTSEAEGHQHAIDVCYWDPSTTSYATSAGAECSHAHAFVLDRATGVVTIAADSGHTHEVDTAAVKAVLDAMAAAMAAEEAERAAHVDPPCEPCAPPSAPMNEGNGTVVVIANRAPNSSPQEATPSVVNKENTQMDTKIAKMLLAVATLPDEQRAHIAKLAPEDMEAFLAKDAEARANIIKSIQANDPVVHTTKSGLQIRKSAGELAVQFAKQADQQAELIEKQGQAIAAAQAQTEQVTLEKRATVEIPNIAKSMSAKIALLKAVDSIADQAQRDEVMASIKSADSAIKLLGKNRGADAGDGPNEDDTSPQATFDKALGDFAKSVNKTPVLATAEFMRTEKGAELYAAIKN